MESSRELALLIFFSKNDIQLVHHMSYVLIFMSVVVLLYSLVAGIPYGRYSWTTKGVDARSAWFVQEFPSFLIPVILVFVANEDRFSYANAILLSLFTAHYFQRTFVYALSINSARPVPYVTFSLGIAFCTFNGYLQGYNLTSVHTYSTIWLKDWRFLFGVGLFLMGMVINIHSDRILRNLRIPNETAYRIPHGGLFELVSGANYLGEIIEWWGFALAGCDLPALAFAISTTSVIGSRAYHHHRWYLQNLQNYPKERKALIPFVF